MPQNLKEKIANLIQNKLGVCGKELPDQILSLIIEELPEEVDYGNNLKHIQYLDGYNACREEVITMLKGWFV